MCIIKIIDLFLSYKHFGFRKGMWNEKGTIVFHRNIKQYDWIRMLGYARCLLVIREVLLELYARQINYSYNRHYTQHRSLINIYYTLIPRKKITQQADTHTRTRKIMTKWRKIREFPKCKIRKKSLFDQRRQYKLLVIKDSYVIIRVNLFYITKCSVRMSYKEMSI